MPVVAVFNPLTLLVLLSVSEDDLLGAILVDHAGDVLSRKTATNNANSLSLVKSGVLQVVRVQNSS